MSSGGHEFGARSRDWGWYPKINQDIWDWYEEAIALVIELEPEAEARVLLASAVRGLWSYPSCREALIRAAEQFNQAQPWIEGWISCRATLRYDGKKMFGDAKAKLVQLIKLLKPADILNKARAVVINRIDGGGGWDFSDGEEENGDAVNTWVQVNELAKDVGRALAQDNAARVAFIAEVLIEPQAQRAFECGVGLAEGANELDVMWDELTAAFRTAAPEARNATVLGGFIQGSHKRDQKFTTVALDGATGAPELMRMLPYFQARIGMDYAGILRLRRAIAQGSLEAKSFHHIANGCVENAPAKGLAELLNDIASLPGGAVVALDILHMRFFSRSKNEEIIQDELLISVGRELLMLLEFTEVCELHDHTVGEVIKTCLCGENGRQAAERVCQKLRLSLETYTVSLWNLNCMVQALFETQPFVALDTFLLPETASLHYSLTDDLRSGNKSVVEDIGIAVLQKWASVDPNKRYPLLGKILRMFKGDDDNNCGFSPLFMSMLNAAPDKRKFIGGLWKRLHPQVWNGSLADILSRRKDLLVELARNADEEVRGWVIDAIPEIEQWIEEERKRDQAREESFE